MRHDRRVRHVIKKYGIEGYGLYCLILEMISERLAPTDPSPELEDSYTDIAEDYNGDKDRIKKMIIFMVSEGLFEQNDTGHVLCPKIYKYLQGSQTRSQYMKNLIKARKQQITLSTSDPQAHIVTDGMRQIEEGKTGDP